MNLTRVETHDRYKIRETTRDYKNFNSYARRKLFSWI